MSWGRIDDRLAEHPKWVRLEREFGARAWADGLAVWTFVLCYANRNETDGAIDATVLARATPIGRAAIKAADGLVAVGLMDRDGPLYILHDFTDYNPSRTELLAKRRVDSERKRGKPTAAVAAESARIPSGVQPEAPRIPEPPAGACVRDPVPARPGPSQEERESASAPPESPLSAPSPGHSLTLDSEVIRKAADRAFKAADRVAPPAVRDLAGKPWVALVPVLREVATRDRVSLEEVADRLMAGFLASPRAREKHYPIGFLTGNPAEYLGARVEPAADLDRLLAGIPRGEVGEPAGTVGDDFGFNDEPKPKKDRKP